MPFLSGMFMILLSLFDLAFSAFTRWKNDKGILKYGGYPLGKTHRHTDNVDSLCSLNASPGIFPPTAILLFVLFRLIEHRSWWRTAIGAVVVTAVFYFGFGVTLGAQLPKGILGFSISRVLWKYLARFSQDFQLLYSRLIFFSVSLEPSSERL